MVLFRIASFVLALLSLVLLVVALVSDNWVTLTEAGWGHFGLWKSCALRSCILHQTRIPGFLHSIRFLMVLAMLAGFLSSSALLASFFCSHVRSVSLTLVSTVGSFSAGVCAVTALAVFTNADCHVLMPEMLFSSWSYSWSYGLGWLSFFLCLGTGAVTLLNPGSSYSRI